MSIIKKPYELSVWIDKWDGEKFVEKKLFIVGTDTMRAPSRAFSPKLVEKTNGDYTFTFTMYTRYQNPTTGNWEDNPFVGQINNETKLKLKYDGKWYDMIVKSVAKDGTNKTVSYTATSQHVQELSKNGFSVELDDKLGNSLGTAGELAERVLEGTGWTVDSEIIIQKIEEGLVPVVLTGIQATLITGKNGTTGIALGGTKTISGNALAFYSCVQDGGSFFQFFYNGTNQFKKDDDRIITEECHYVIKEPIYDGALPQGISFLDNSLTISTEYRGEKVVFSPIQRYYPLLDTYVIEYEGPNEEGKIVKCYGYDDIEVITPNLIQDFVTNGDFKSGIDGWKSSVVLTKKQKEEKDYKKEDYLPTYENIAYRIDGDNLVTLEQDYFGGNFNEEQVYTPGLLVDFKHAVTNQENALPSTNLPYGILINSGLYDSRTNLCKTNFVNGSRFRIECEYKVVSKDINTETGLVKYSIQDADSMLGLYIVSYDENLNATVTGHDTALSGQNMEWKPTILAGALDENGDIKKIELKGDTNGTDIEIINLSNSSDEWIKNSHIRIFLVNESENDHLVLINKFRIYPLVEDDNGEIITPETQKVEASVRTNKIIFPIQDANGNEIIYTDKESIAEVFSGVVIPPEYQIQYNLGADAVRNIKAKESNYFNILQNIAETFQCWVHLEVGHDESGKVTSKAVQLRNYIGKNNFAGFRYGVNLKDIKRTDDSKSIVTKLVVKTNSNKHGPNGFCSISRASSNVSKDNVLYDFTYHVNQRQLDAWLYYRELAAYELSIGEIGEDLLRTNEEYNNLLVPLTQCQADVSFQQGIVDAAVAEIEEKAIEFYRLADFDYLDQKRVQEIKESDELKKYALELLELRNNKATAERLLGAEGSYGLLNTLRQYEDRKVYLEGEINNLQEQKRALQFDFQQKFSRFIQEGTWINENYFDDDKYYGDAQSTLYNSCMPKVSYTISVIEISAIPGYEMFTFGLGDNTYMEDPEFFGYNRDGSPYREEIVVTETTKNLDEPEKDSIKVQNHKTQFQDLFQKITATTQQVKYSEGSYNKAADLANADTAGKSQFLQSALNDANTLLQNSGEQTVTWDTRGIVVTDKQSPSNQLRIVGGAILMREMGEDGVERWATALTNKGISASHITSGQLDTGVLQIMNGDSPTFRWDSFGLTAYDFIPIEGKYTTNINSDKGVRFDRFGLYGFNKTGGAGWHPASIKEVRDNSVFMATWDGFEFNKDGYAHLGNAGNGQLLAVGEDKDKINFSVTPTGIIRAHKAEIDGKIESNEGYIGGWKISENNILSDSALVGLHSGKENYDSLILGRPKSPIRFYAGVVQETEKTEYTIIEAIPDNLEATSNVGVTFQYLDIVTSSDIPDSDYYYIVAYNSSSRGHGANNYDYTGYDKEYIGMVDGIFPKYRIYFEIPQSDWAFACDPDGNPKYTLQVINNNKQNAYFKVLEDGSLYASAADISGVIHADKGDIGGWKISENGLCSEDNSIRLLPKGDANSLGNFVLKNDDAWVITANDTFGVTKNGALYASDGLIAGWQIGSDRLSFGNYDNDGSVHLIPAGTTEARSNFALENVDEWVITAGKNFGVTKNGAMYTNKGYIGGWKINANSLVYGEFGKDNSFYMYATEHKVSNQDYRLAIGEGLKVTNTGAIYAQSFYGKSGDIGSFKFSSKGLFKANDKYGFGVPVLSEEWAFYAGKGDSYSNMDLKVSFDSRINMSNNTDTFQTSMDLREKLDWRKFFDYNNRPSTPGVTNTNYCLLLSWESNSDGQLGSESVDYLHDNIKSSYPWDTALVPTQYFISYPEIVKSQLDKVRKYYIELDKTNNRLVFTLKTSGVDVQIDTYVELVTFSIKLPCKITHKLIIDSNGDIFSEGKKGITNFNTVELGGRRGYFKNGLFVEE